MLLPNVVLFRGVDALNDPGLWETDGTGTGTFDLAPAGAATSGIFPGDLTLFNGQVLFEGVDSSGDLGLWTSDGTTLGTVELTSIVGANSTTGLSPTAMTVFGSEALFSGLNTSNQTGLWTTNGTALGTQEVTGIGGAASTGVMPTDLTVFNGVALFNGVNTAGHLGLWVTNGTALGTQELTIASASTTGLDPTDMAVFNNEVLFNGVDASQDVGLWVTNGTVAGTKELTGILGANSTTGLNPTNLTAFGGEVLFSGLDASGDMGLWVTNGTAVGTHELTGINGADASGLAPSDLIVYDGEVLFRGLDQSGRPQLWITNGTAIGTKMLTGIAGAATTTVGLDPSGLVLYDGVVLFNGTDLSDHNELWETNGTAAGTTEVNPIAGTESLGLSPVDLTAIGGPSLTAGASTSYVAGALAVTLHPGLISDPESATLTGATVSISAGFLAGDVLSVASRQTGIASNYNWTTGVLTLSGSASLAAYQAELDSVTFGTASGANASRAIAWSISDANATSTPASSIVSIVTDNPDVHVILRRTNGQLALWQVNGTTLSASGLLSPNPGPSWHRNGRRRFLWRRYVGHPPAKHQRRGRLVARAGHDAPVIRPGRQPWAKLARRGNRRFQPGRQA